MEYSFFYEHFYLAVFALFFISTLAGFIDSISGGAGLILVPSFILVGLQPQVALGQEKFISSIGSLAAIKNYFSNKLIIWKAIPVGLITTFLGVSLGVKIVLIITTKIAYIIILIFLPISLALFFFGEKIVKKLKTKQITTDGKYVNIKIGVACFFVGIYDGLFGPGSGTMFIILLRVICGMNILHASATSKLLNFISSASATIGFIIAGKVYFLLAIPLGIGSFIGNYVGSHINIKTDGLMIKKFLTVVVLLITVLLIVNMFSNKFIA